MSALSGHARLHPLHFGSDRSLFLAPNIDCDLRFGNRLGWANYLNGQPIPWFVFVAAFYIFRLAVKVLFRGPILPFGMWHIRTMSLVRVIMTYIYEGKVALAGFLFESGYRSTRLVGIFKVGELLVASDTLSWPLALELCLVMRVRKVPSDLPQRHGLL